MQILEIKNNLVKIAYDTAQENLVLSGFVVINDPSLSFIAQVIHLEADSDETFAVAKLLFTFDSNGVIKNYNGAIPSINSIVNAIKTQELLDVLPAKNPVVIGELAQQKTVLKLDKKLLDEKLLVCCEKNSDLKLLTKNFIAQLLYQDKKILFIDFEGASDLSKNKIVAGRNFKLPLTYDTMNFIYKELDGATAHTKALIQEVLLEVQNYVKTLNEGFLPFETFKDVVDSQYQEMGLVELILLKNRLLKYHDEGVFAQGREEFDSLKNAMLNEKLSILDLSSMDENIQKEMIAYVYSILDALNEEIYVFLNINNENSDKKVLKKIFGAKKVYSTLMCDYSYKYLKEMKQLCANLVLFAPIQQQEDFASYNAFLKKLNPQEFVIYGSATHHMPFIVKMDDSPQNMFEEGPAQEIPAQEVNNTEFQTSESEEGSYIDEEIKKDLDEIYTVPKSEKNESSFEAQSQETSEEGFSDDDLDFIDSLSDEMFSELSVEEDSQEGEEISIEPEIVETETLQEKEPEQEELINHTPAFEEEIEVKAQDEILPVQAASVPIVPVYSADIEPKAQSDSLEQGDAVVHAKYGKGVVEKLITYGSKTLCSIHFDNVGRRLLDPTLAEIKKV